MAISTRFRLHVEIEPTGSPDGTGLRQLLALAEAEIA